MNLEQKIESLLFFRAEPIKIKKLCEMLALDEESVESALLSLDENLKNRGVVLMRNSDEVTLGTHPEASDLIQKIQKEELNKELSKASLETLSIILYKNGVSRSEIDYIRGVNSTFSLRALSVRGLIESVPDPLDARKLIWKPTMDMLSYLGIKSSTELPDYESIRTALDKTKEIEETQAQNNQN